MSTLLLSILQSASSLELDQQMQQAAPSPAVMMIMGLIWLLVFVFLIITGWKIFTKAGEPGWASLIPIYNIFVLLKICGKPLWWIILVIIPFVNFVFIPLLCIALAKSFGKSTGFGIGLFFLGIIFGPILAFGDAQYQGPKS